MTKSTGERNPRTSIWSAIDKRARRQQQHGDPAGSPEEEASVLQRLKEEWAGRQATKSQAFALSTRDRVYCCRLMKGTLVDIPTVYDRILARHLAKSLLVVLQL